MEKSSNNIDLTVSIERGQVKPYNAEAERDANVIGKRLMEERKQNKLTLSDISEALKKYGVDVTRQLLSKWETGKAVPNSYQLIALCHVLNIEDGIFSFTTEKKMVPLEAETKVSELSPEGIAKLEEYKKLLILSGLYKPIPETMISDIKYVVMRVSTLGVSAGTGNILDESNFEEISVPENEVPKGVDFGIRVNGNSMEPVYHDKQIVWIKRCSELRPGEVGIFEYDGNGYMKMYDERTPGEDVLDHYTTSDGIVRKQPVLVSYNKKYSPIVVSPYASFIIAGRVIK